MIETTPTRLRGLIGLCLLLLATPAVASKVNSDYDPKYPADKIKTFAWDPGAGTLIKQTSELLDDHIVASIDRQLDAEGFRAVKSDPDVYVTYHADVEESVKLSTEVYNYYIPTGWYWGPIGGSVTTYAGGLKTATNARTYQRGTLIVDVWDARSKQLIWRGTATDVAVSWDPKKIEKRLDKALNEMFAQWKKIRETPPTETEQP